MRKPLALCFSLLVLCAALTGCTLHQGSASAASAASPSAAASEGPTLRLGVCLPQDDPVSDLIYTGAEYALLARPSIQLDGVTYSVELYWPSADDAASLAQKLADSGCAAVLGGLDAAACAFAANPFRQASLPLLSLASDDGKVTKANDLLFSAAPTAQAQGQALAKWALEQKLTQAALLTCVTDPYSVGVSDSFTQQLEAQEGQGADHPAGDRRSDRLHRGAQRHQKSGRPSSLRPRGLGAGHPPAESGGGAGLKSPVGLR